jgi:isopentenyl diphosphate isomerase/L-lactate dehydrogenase-like FMN-dependent dehydrogenase
MEISVDALCFEGQVFLTGVADRLIEIKDAHFFIENGHTLPSHHGPPVLADIQRVLQDYADALATLSGKPYHGALKGDLRLARKNEIMIGEIAGRLSGGFMSTHTYPAAHGRDLMQMFIRLMLNDKSVIMSQQDAAKTEGIAIERSLYAQPGIISGLPDAVVLDGIRKRYSAEGLREIVCNYRNGDAVAGLQNNIGKVFHTVIHAPSLEAAEDLFTRVRSELTFSTSVPPYNARVMSKISREKFNNDFCWVCKVCDGGYCASGVPGMGARGEMNSFRDNVTALSEFKVAPAYLEKPNIAEPDTNFDLFGNNSLRFNAPILSAPITGSVTNMGGSITEYDYAIETGTAMKNLKLLPTFGDGATYDKYRVGLHAIRQLKTGIPIFKPRANQDELLRRIGEARDAGAVAWGIDIDGVSFKTMVNKSALTSHKSVAELRALAAAGGIPFIIKGVMTEKDALYAIEAGAAAIVVSNHGGRVLDGMPGTARVLPRIAELVRRESPETQVFCDGGIRSGTDIFRMLALGADAVLIGRPIAIMAVGHGRAGVQSLMQHYLDEFRQTMRVCGIANLAAIESRHISKFI